MFSGELFGVWGKSHTHLVTEVFSVTVERKSSLFVCVCVFVLLYANEMIYGWGPLDSFGKGAGRQKD